MKTAPDITDEKLVKLGIDIEKGMPEGLKIGDKAPDFTTVDHKGNEVQLNKMLEKGKVVLFFYRGYWCPVCNRYLSEFKDSLSLITDKGAQVIAVTPETTENAGKTMTKNELEFPVISDSDLSIMNDYKVTFNVTDEYVDKINDKLQADIATYNGREQAELPIPATFVINQDGLIDYVYFNPVYHKRARVSEIVEHL